MLVFISHSFIISHFDAKAQDCDTEDEGSDTKAQAKGLHSDAKKKKKKKAQAVATDAHDFSTKACFRP